MKIRPAAVATAGLLVLGLAACGNSKSQSTGGSTDSGSASGTFTVSTNGCPADATKELAAGETIKIGTSQPLSGPLASAGLGINGVRAYFERINRAGGINGHKLELVAKDDAFDAARAVSNAQAFTGPEKVFANLMQVGTPAIRATQPIYEAACVPQLWAIATSATLGHDPAGHRWTANVIPPAPVESKAIADYIAQTKPGASVVELVGPEDLAKDFHASFPKAAKDAGLKVLDPQTVPAGATSVETQVAAMVAAKPDAVFLETQPNYCPGFLTALARSGYKGIIAVNSSCNGAGQWISPVDPAGDGLVTPMFRKDPADPRYKDDPAMQEYLKDLEAIGASKNAPVGNVLDGYNHAVLLVQNLKDAAAMKGGLTRANLMTAAWNTKISRPLELEPNNATAGPDDPYLVESGEIVQYSAATKGWTTKSKFAFEGKTNQFK
ncbi:ABC transporter substrate-binding protein [Planosporangium mesophilum]|uniref:ABC transporter substrate-binding protein n=1 Tax=Planosporangium mesophilum TaxID=689768 RepID=A0A8J3TH46_9ACTN|nr:ABC transporter substrate-binding protein [Planosporangium mesophilum]NJC85890.1 ABC transporter substrate-binding protein [Planosporangium mesophilum]GII25062.1 ABC transporter substrate-binding protein [Planosporangium mesophilum]